MVKKINLKNLFVAFFPIFGLLFIILLIILIVILLLLFGVKEVVALGGDQVGPAALVELADRLAPRVGRQLHVQPARPDLEGLQEEWSLKSESTMKFYLIQYLEEKFFSRGNLLFFINLDVFLILFINLIIC
jgi:hypothetical protein